MPPTPGGRGVRVVAVARRPHPKNKDCGASPASVTRPLEVPEGMTRMARAPPTTSGGLSRLVITPDKQTAEVPSRHSPRRGMSSWS